MLGDDPDHNAKALAAKADKLWAYHSHQFRRQTEVVSLPQRSGKPSANCIYQKRRKCTVYGHRSVSFFSGRPSTMRLP